MKGRAVYGGGGILPDHIIKSKHDSLPTSLVYLYTSDFFNNLAFDYTDNVRETNNSFENFKIIEDEKKIILMDIEKWIVGELGNDENKARLRFEIRENQHYIMERLSALIIRQLWGWPKMQIFLNQNDEIITTSLSLLK